MPLRFPQVIPDRRARHTGQGPGVIDDERAATVVHDRGCNRAQHGLLGEREPAGKAGGMTPEKARRRRSMLASDRGREPKRRCAAFGGAGSSFLASINVLRSCRIGLAHGASGIRLPGPVTTKLCVLAI